MDSVSFDISWLPFVLVQLKDIEIFICSAVKGLI